MVLAFEARLSPVQRKALKALYNTTHLNTPTKIHEKMLELISKSRAAGTLASYTPVINKWKVFCSNHGFQNMPASKKALAEFVAHLALQNETITTFRKLGPALKYHHDANGSLERGCRSHR